MPQPVRTIHQVFGPTDVLTKTSENWDLPADVHGIQAGSHRSEGASAKCLEAS